LLRNEIYQILDDAEYLAQLDWDETDEALARKTIPDLTTVIRGLIAEHESSDTGQCRACACAWPCQVTECVHALVKDPDRAFGEILSKLRDL
jgi:hypothetical protein